jgi:Lrp/AsnC family transcriptional regulator for asnA, asnC and gidA
MVHKDIPAALSPELRELDELDRKLISVLKIDGRESLATIGTQIGLTGDSVKDRLDRLTAEGVIKVTCSVDPRVLGFNSIALVGVKVTGSAELIAAELTSVSEFDFVCCVSGEYDILVEVVCRDDVHLLRVVDQYLRSRPDVSSVSSHNYLAVLKFQPSGSPEEPETGAPPHPGVDDIDRKIIRALQDDGRASFQDIALSIGVPYQTTRRRAKALLEGKIVRTETLVNRLIEGTAIVAGVNLRTTGPIAEIAEKLLSLPEVEIAAVTSGRFDLLLEVACKDRDHLATLVGSVLPSIPGIASSETSIYQRVLKLPQSWSGLVRK